MESRIDALENRTYIEDNEKTKSIDKEKSNAINVILKIFPKRSQYSHEKKTHKL